MEGPLGAPQLAQHPEGVAQVGPGLGAQVEHPVRVVGLVDEELRDADRELRERQRLERALGPGLEAPPEQGLTEAPGLEALVVSHHRDLDVEGMRRQLLQQLRRLPPFEDRHPLVPVLDLALQAGDLLVGLAADRADRQEMGDYPADQLLVLQVPREPPRQGLDRKMGLVHVRSLPLESNLRSKREKMEPKDWEEFSS